MEPVQASAAPPSEPPVAASSSNLAMVVDKRPSRRPGGCIGIFFQLFDWNRRLAKKRFFSRKLLPQDRAARRISKKFAGEERMPAATKPAVIAAENQGGFGNAKKVETETALRPSFHNSDREKRMISPSLVARLMGLESMPVVSAARLDKPRKAVDDATSSSVYVEHSVATSGSPPKPGQERSGGCHGKLQLRSQRLNKLGFFEKRPASTGREALLFSRGMLGRSRKQHYKLASPVKSPRLSGRRSSSRLMEAATRILEPGLQARNRARSALTYAAPSKANADGIDAVPRPTANTFVSPCHNCGSLVEVPDIRLKASESPSMEYQTSSPSSDLSSTSSHSRFSEILQKGNKRAPSLAIQAKTKHFVSERRPCSGNESQEQGRPQLDAAAPMSALKQSISRRNEVSFERDKPASPARLGTRKRGGRVPVSSFDEPKEFIGSDRSINNINRRRISTPSMINRRIETERSSWERRKSISIGDRKGSRIIAARTLRVNPVKGDQVQNLLEGKCTNRGKAAAAHSLSGGSSAPAGSNKIQNGSTKERRVGGVGHGHEGGSRSGTSMATDLKAGKLSSVTELDKKISALTVLLEQKIREFKCLNLDKSETGDGVLSSRPTATILEELISALTVARSISMKKGEDSCSGLTMKDYSCYDFRGQPRYAYYNGRMLDTVQSCQAEAKSGFSTGLLNMCDYEQLSPMSILEASFSNDSCLSESFNSSSVSGYRHHVGYTEGSFDKILPRDLDADFSDSATSSHMKKVETWKASQLLDSVIHSLGLDTAGYLGSKINYFREIILNVDLLFQSISTNIPGRALHSPMESIFLDTLEILGDALGMGRSCNLNYSEKKEALQFRSFLFDCIMENLDMKYTRFTKMGFKAWSKMPPFISETLALEIYEAITNCRDQASEFIDEMIQKEMDFPDQKWMDFQLEGFEAGVEIENDLLLLLVDEIAIDLCP